MTASFGTVNRTNPGSGDAFAVYTNGAGEQVQRTVVDWESRMDAVWHAYSLPTAPATFLNREAEPGGLVTVGFTLLNTPQVAAQLWLQVFDSVANPVSGVTPPFWTWPIIGGFIWIDFSIPMDFTVGCGTAISTTPAVYTAPPGDAGCFFRQYWPRAGT